jgi:hypothetical protein
MRKYVYVCDRCKKESEDLDNFTHLSVKTNGIHIKGCDNFSQTEYEICKDCLKEIGFAVEGGYDEIATANRQTLDEKITDILLDLGVVFDM